MVGESSIINDRLHANNQSPRSSRQYLGGSKHFANILNMQEVRMQSEHQSNKEEDDEAVEIAHHPHYNKGNTPALQASLTMVQKKSVDKKKHWLLDSSRFNNVM